MVTASTSSGCSACRRSSLAAADSSSTEARGGLSLGGTERGILAHALLEKLDFRRPLVPSAAAIIEAADRTPSAAEAEELAELIRRFASSELCARLGRAGDSRREERFAFLLDSGVLMTGVFDVLAREPGNRLLVVDYKSDRLEGAEPRAVVGELVPHAAIAIRAGRDPRGSPRQSRSCTCSSRLPTIR